MYLSAFAGALNGRRQILEGTPSLFCPFLFVFPPAWRILLLLAIFVQVFNMGYAGKDCICCRYQARNRQSLFAISAASGNPGGR